MKPLLRKNAPSRGLFSFHSGRHFVSTCFQWSVVLPITIKRPLYTRIDKKFEKQREDQARALREMQNFINAMSDIVPDRKLFQPWTYSVKISLKYARECLETRNVALAISLKYSTIQSPRWPFCLVCPPSWIWACNPYRLLSGIFGYRFLQSCNCSVLSLVYAKPQLNSVFVL